MVIWPLTGRDRNCPQNIEKACHALALDEQRLSFAPTLWNEAANDCADNENNTANADRINQVWFPGVHANIGGGYPDDTLALVSLQWMLKQAEKQGLIFKPDALSDIEDNANINGPIADSRSGMGFIYRLGPRHIENLGRQKSPGLANWLKQRCVDAFPVKVDMVKNYAKKKDLQHRFNPIEQNEIHIETPKIHHSIIDRIGEPGNAYAPLNLPGHYSVVDDENQVIKTETSEAVPDRRILQSKPWNLVGQRKIIYVINSLLVSAMVIFALHSLLTQDSISVLDLLEPNTWLTFLLANKQLLIPITLVLTLLKCGGNLKSEMNSDLLKIWQPAKYRSQQTHTNEIPEPAMQNQTSVVDRGWLDNYFNDKGELVVSTGMKIIRAWRILAESLAVLILLGVILTLIIGTVRFFTGG